MMFNHGHSVHVAQQVYKKHCKEKCKADGLKSSMYAHTFTDALSGHYVTSIRAFDVK